MSRSDDGTADAHTTAGETSVDLSRPDERIAHDRARYLETTTELRAKEAYAVAWSELGYSSSGIAKQIDRGASTVSTYLERAIAQYGPEAAHARASFDVQRSLSEVADDEIVSWPAHYRETWRQAVERHPDRAPAAATPKVGGST